MGQLDLLTLFVVAVFVALLVGALLLLTWARERSQTALVWWGVAHLLAAPGWTLLGLRGQIPDLWSIGVGNFIMVAALAIAWGGARRFERRKIQPLLMALPAMLWLAAMIVPAFYETAVSGLRVALFAAILSFYAAMTAREFWRGRSEKLLSRWPAIALLLAHCTWFAARFVWGVATPDGGDDIVGNYPWIVLTTFEILIYGVAFAFLVISMAKERGEARYRTAAGIDPLTGAANRRAFAEGMARVSSRADHSETRAAFLLFDLDHFKAVNDTRGHLLGDQVLRMFADLVRSNLRPGDLFSRIGGEEFAAILMGVDQSGALTIAERIRSNFEQAGRSIAGHDVGVTVSIGIATREKNPDNFDAMFDEADVALYLAKAAGRNRVRHLDELSGANDTVPDGKHHRQMPPTPAAA